MTVLAGHERVLNPRHLAAHVFENCLSSQVVKLRKQFLVKLILIELVFLQVAHQVIRVVARTHSYF